MILGTASHVGKSIITTGLGRVFADDYCMAGSDGLPSEGKPHPRLYGTMPRVVQEYVREQPLMTLEEAVRKMTSLPAAVFGFEGRGVVREGAFADLVVFDPAKVKDEATYANPQAYPSGIPHVLVNGVFVVRDGKTTGARPGTILLRKRTYGG